MTAIKERTKEVAIFERLLQTAIWSKVETRDKNWSNFFNFREKHPELKSLQLLIGTEQPIGRVDKWINHDDLIGAKG